MIGSDESYLKTSGYSVALGRNFTNQEVYNGSSVVIIGDEIYQKLFKGTINPIGEFMTIGGVRYQVIGVLKSKGSSAGMGLIKPVLFRC